jgi:hypothetical protein
MEDKKVGRWGRLFPIGMGRFCSKKRCNFFVYVNASLMIGKIGAFGGYLGTFSGTK